MFTVEVRVNGTLVLHVYGHNTSPRMAIPGEQEDVCSYSYEAYATNCGDTVRGNVMHHRGNGIGALVSKILDSKQVKGLHT